MWSPHRGGNHDLRGYVEQLAEPPSDAERGDLRTLLDHQWGALCQSHTQMVAAHPQLCVAGKLKANRLKNRHHDVLPNDKTRVKLQIEDGQSDYINANFIDGKAFCLPHHNFITAQAPTRNTIAEFWRMIWECDVEVIVMLTNEYERNKEKCSRYWPDPPSFPDDDPCLVCQEFNIRWCDPREMYAQLHRQHDYSPPPSSVGATVRPLASHRSSPGPATAAPSTGDIDIRRFYVFYRGMRREVIQMHHCSWPDHSVPDPSSTGFRDLIQLSNEHIAAGIPRGAGAGPVCNVGAGPILVHCSAGIGRTGCFIVVMVLAALYELHCRAGKVPAEFSFDVVGTIHTLRRQRAGMVQSLDQLQYVYHSLLVEVQRIHHALGITDAEKPVS
eukprot:TRINITY_DN12500_c0_g1_i1.p1 TRINITY_DN12500_c0_g1~~TRINITY_DN12500_c0_g1_i1.p1  ORF type:complete len:386 (+),score=87.55 TRINITY_DN12500_c0_g1_i1:39-1196(+)